VERSQKSSVQPMRWHFKRRVQNRDDFMRLTPTRVQLTWGVLGLLVGIFATAIFLVAVAPEPLAIRIPPIAASDISITMDDAALSNLTAAGVAQANLPFTVTNIHDHILPNNVVQITGDVPLLGGIEVRRLSATATLTAEQGHVALHVKMASVGGFGLPAVATSAFETAFDARSAQLTRVLSVGSTHYDVSGVSSTEGRLTLRLTRAP
jgi:hypothetical protein